MGSVMERKGGSNSGQINHSHSYPNKIFVYPCHCPNQSWLPEKVMHARYMQAVLLCKARFPLPELTARVGG